MARITTLTSKGQVTVPKEVRDQLGLKAHDKIKFDVDDGYATLRRLPRLEEIVGSLPPLGMPIEEAIAQAKEERAQRLIAKMRES